MSVFNQAPNFDFMGKRRLAEILSAVLIVVSLVSIFTRGLNLGIDFTGGVLLEVAYAEAADLADIRNALTEAGFAAPLVQNFGTVSEALIRLAPQEGQDGGQIRDRVLSALEARDPTVELRRIEFVGPQVGQDLTEQGSLAMLSPRVYRQGTP